jgi:hypothetical protein
VFHSSLGTTKNRKMSLPSPLGFDTVLASFQRSGGINLARAFIFGDGLRFLGKCRTGFSLSGFELFGVRHNLQFGGRNQKKTG